MFLFLLSQSMGTQNNVYSHLSVAVSASTDKSFKLKSKQICFATYVLLSTNIIKWEYKVGFENVICLY